MSDECTNLLEEDVLPSNLRKEPILGVVASADGVNQISIGIQLGISIP